MSIQFFFFENNFRRVPLYYATAYGIYTHERETCTRYNEHILGGHHALVYYIDTAVYIYRASDGIVSRVRVARD